MDTFEKVGYTSLGLLALLGIVGMLAGMVITTPGRIIGLLVVIGIGALVLKVIKERLNNEEDDHYSKTVEK